MTKPENTHLEKLLQQLAEDCDHVLQIAGKRTPLILAAVMNGELISCSNVGLPDQAIIMADLLERLKAKLKAVMDENAPLFPPQA